MFFLKRMRRHKNYPIPNEIAPVYDSKTGNPVFGYIFISRFDGKIRVHEISIIDSKYTVYTVNTIDDAWEIYFRKIEEYL